MVWRAQHARILSSADATERHVQLSVRERVVANVDGAPVEGAALSTVEGRRVTGSQRALPA
eukprot:4729274-Pyramimonas_sp.AAC.1